MDEFTIGELESEIARRKKDIQLGKQTGAKLHLLKHDVMWFHSLGSVIGQYREKNKAWDSDGKSLKDISLFEFTLWCHNKSNESRAELYRLQKEIDALKGESNG